MSHSCNLTWDYKYEQNFVFNSQLRLVFNLNHKLTSYPFYKHISLIFFEPQTLMFWTFGQSRFLKNIVKCDRRKFRPYVNFFLRDLNVFVIYFYRSLFLQKNKIHFTPLSATISLVIYTSWLGACVMLSDRSWWNTKLLFHRLWYLLWCNIMIYFRYFLYSFSYVNFFDVCKS